ncbi:hypothetical protein N7532_007366 [Penicillium argentinense]|uniref:Uncharacterized protein n=1 Tax=Penicillium argentinense TaxID=1131581 RepID=A0A9W9F7J8_9EURO|nr:uncharacterized protein N7532_007366 [Penicillium argentinense]KAJ5095075.1 hypothetical protein N7532_007366 [Penicillium argentinense]
MSDDWGLPPWEEPIVIMAANKLVLFRAIEKGPEDVAQLLFKEYAEVDALDGHGRTLLLQAIASKNQALTEQLLKTGVPVDLFDFHGHTSLILVAQNGSAPIVSCLLNTGANPNARDWHYGRTGLSRVAEKGNEDIVVISAAQTCSVPFATPSTDAMQT